MNDDCTKLCKGVRGLGLALGILVAFGVGVAAMALGVAMLDAAMGGDMNPVWPLAVFIAVGGALVGGVCAVRDKTR